VAGQQRILGVAHPPLQAGAQVREQRRVGGVAGEVVGLVGVEHQVVELLFGNLHLRPAVADQQVLARAVVGVGQHRRQTIAPAADELVAGGADRPLGLIRGVPGGAREHLLAHAVGLAPEHRQQRHPFQERRALDPEVLAHRRVDVYV
jgi:hypothetical protein